MDANDVLRLVSILTAVAGVVVCFVVLFPRQMDDMKLINGYRDFKKRLNRMSLSLMLLLLAFITIDLMRLEDSTNELIISLVVVVRTLMAVNVIYLFAHLYNYKVKE